MYSIWLSTPVISNLQFKLKFLRKYLNLHDSWHVSGTGLSFQFDEIQTNLTAEIDYNKNMSTLLEGATRQLELLHRNSAQQHDMLSELSVKVRIHQCLILKLSKSLCSQKD